MLLLKSIISAIILNNSHKMKKCSKLVKSISRYYTSCLPRMYPPDIGVRNVDDAVNICKTIEFNVMKCKDKWKYLRSGNFLSFFSFDVNKKQLYEGLEIYLGDYYFNSFSRYAFLVILIEQNLYNELYLFIKKRMKALNKNKLKYGALMTKTLVSYQKSFEHSEKFTYEELNGFFLRYRMSKLYMDCTRNYENFDMFFKLFSFKIYDHIDKFFENRKAIDLVKEDTYEIYYYILELTTGRIKDQTEQQRKYTFDLMRKISMYYEIKLNEYIHKGKYDLICEISDDILNENSEFKTIFDHLRQTVQPNIIVEKIKLMLSKYAFLIDGQACTQQFSVKMIDKVNFSKLCETNKIPQAMNYLQIFERNDLFFIKEFFKNICLQGEMFSICDQMFGSFIILTIIIQHQEQEECSYVDLEKAWDLLENSLKEKTTIMFVLLFILSESYFKLIIKHLNYKIINLGLKNMPKFNYDYKYLIKLIFGRYYSIAEEQSIEKNLQLIIYNSTDEDRLRVALKSRENLLSKEDNAIDHFNKSIVTIDRPDQFDSRHLRNKKFEEYKYTSNAKINMKKVENFSLILQDYNPKDGFKRISDTCKIREMKFRMVKLCDEGLLKRRCVKCAMKIMFDEMLKLCETFPLECETINEIKAMRDKMEKLCDKCSMLKGCGECLMKLTCDNILLGTRAIDEIKSIGDEGVELCEECKLERVSSNFAMEIMFDGMIKLFENLIKEEGFKYERK